MRRLRLTTFNIQHASARGLAGPWSRRRRRVTDLIRACDPDVLCLQEVAPGQLEDLRHDLPEWECQAGVASGPTLFHPAVRPLRPLLRLLVGGFLEVGEYCPILFRRDRFRVTDAGGDAIAPAEQRGQWSGTPHVVTWVRLADSRTGTTLEVFNTHLALLPAKARAEARALRGLLAEHAGDHLQVLAGDFNSTPRGGVVRALLAESGDGDEALHDAWRLAPQPRGRAGSYHAGIGLPGPRIDHILVRPRAEVLHAELATGRDAGRFPSDHAAPNVQIRLPEIPAGESSGVTKPPGVRR